jgi:chromosome segregation ATPase
MATDFVDLGRLPTIINDLSKWGVESKVQQKSISAQLASMRKEFDMMSKSTNSRLRDIDLGMKKLNDAGHEQAKLSSALEESLKSMDSLIEKATENNRSLRVLQGKVGGFESTLAEMKAQIKESQRVVALSEGFKEASNILEGGGPVFPPLPLAYSISCL